MGLKSQPEYTAAPQFEPMETAVETAVAPQTATKEETMTTNTTDTAASASVQATTAIATAAASSAVVAGSTPTKFKVAFVYKNNGKETETDDGLALAETGT